MHFTAAAWQSELKGDEAGANTNIAAARQIGPDIAKDFERYGVRAP